MPGFLERRMGEYPLVVVSGVPAAELREGRARRGPDRLFRPARTVGREGAIAR